MAMVYIGVHSGFQIGFMMQHVRMSFKRYSQIDENIFSSFFSSSILVYSSVYLTVSFTLERYISVCHPLRGQVLCTESRAKKVITGKKKINMKFC